MFAEQVLHQLNCLGLVDFPYCLQSHDPMYDETDTGNKRKFIALETSGLLETLCHRLLKDLSLKSFKWFNTCLPF